MFNNHRQEIMLMFDSGFVILDMQHKTEGDVVDVFIGEERTHFRLPVKLAHGLMALLRQKPVKTKSTPAHEDVWEAVLGDHWLEEDSEGSEADDPDPAGRTFPVWGVGREAYHVTEPVELPEIGIEVYKAFKDWARNKKKDLLKASDGKEIRVSTRYLHRDLWQSMTHVIYDKNVRADSEGVETDSDPDEDVGEGHGGDYLTVFPSLTPEPSPPRKENWQIIERRSRPGGE